MYIMTVVACKLYETKLIQAHCLVITSQLLTNVYVDLFVFQHYTYFHLVQCVRREPGAAKGFL